MFWCFEIWSIYLVKYIGSLVQQKIHVFSRRFMFRILSFGVSDDRTKTLKLAYVMYVILNIINLKQDRHMYCSSILTQFFASFLLEVL
jgi:hypothetical protein